LPKISAFKQFYLRKQELDYCVYGTATWRSSYVSYSFAQWQLVFRSVRHFWDDNFDDIRECTKDGTLR